MSEMYKRLVVAAAALSCMAMIAGCESSGMREPAFEDRAVSESELAKIEAETAELRRQAAALAAEHEHLEAEHAATKAEAEELQRLIEQVRKAQDAEAAQQRRSGSNNAHPQ